MQKLNMTDTIVIVLVSRMEPLARVFHRGPLLSQAGNTNDRL